MSFGFSPSDCALLLKGLWRITNLLLGEATDGFGRYQRTYRQLTSVAETLYQFAKEAKKQGQESWFAVEIDNIQRILEVFFSSIQQLKPHLGSKRSRFSLRSAIKKVTWPIHAGRLEQLHKDLMCQMNILMLLKQFQTGQNLPIVATGSMAPTDYFYFEDARRELRKINFVSVSSWEDLQEFLLRVFPRGDPGHEMIRRHRYLLHKSDRETSILRSSPGIKPFRDVIKKDEKVQMSMIFEYKESYKRKCPSCRSSWSAKFSGAGLACHKCELLIRFEDSHDDKPDPLTEIALGDIRTDGMRKFVQDSVREENSVSGHSASETDGLSLQLDRWLRDRSTDLESGSTTFRQPKIRKFKMVTVCKSRWPDLSRHGSHQNAIDRISKTMKGVERAIQYLQSEDFPLVQFAALLNSRFGGARAAQGTLRFLRSMFEAYESRKALIVWSQRTNRLLSEYIKLVEDTGAQFCKSVLRTRCLFWICRDMLRVQRGLLLECSGLLNLTVRQILVYQRPYGRPKTPLAVKLLFLPHTALMIPWRLTFDLMGDAAELFAEKKPLYIVSAMQQFLERADEIALHFYLDGNLSHYFDIYKPREGDVCGKFPPAGRSWMEDVMRSKGQLLGSAEVFQHLLGMIREGYT